MSFKAHEMWSVVCDFPGCGRDAQEDTDYVAWDDQHQAWSDAAACGGWEVFDGKHLCGDHWHWCDNAVDDDAKAGPAQGCCLSEVVLVVLEEQ